MPLGKIHLIPSFLGQQDESIIPSQVKNIVSGLDEFIVENAKTARRFLRAIGYTKNFDTEVTLHELDKHAARQDCKKLLHNVLQGKSCGIISEAGNPCIADPGSEIVAYAHRHNIQVVPHVGPSAILLALIASGFNGQQFAFNGYLPIKEPDRSRKIKQLENSANNTTQIFMETPFRNQKLLEEILRQCTDTTRLCIACNLTLPTQYIATKTIAEWRRQPAVVNKQYCIFLMG